MSCKWVDGEFKPCLNMTGFFERRENIIGFTKDKAFYGKGISNFCPSCGADIRQPEPEVIIKKSGGAWVSRFEEIDFLLISTSNFTIENVKTHFELYIQGLNCDFKPISEIEITDEIAKLRPMVIRACSNKKEKLRTLYAVLKTIVFFRYVIEGNLPCNSEVVSDIDYRLATVSDLTDKTPEN